MSPGAVSMNTTMSAAPIRPVSWERAPAFSATGVRDEDAEIGNPPNSPLARFDTPMAAISWLPPTDSPRRAAKVLLVDDEDLVRTATADMLRDIGYVVVEVSSASQALSAIRAGVDADVLVSDYLMPGMTGGQLISELRAAGNRIPALLVTGYAAAGDDVPGDVIRLAKPFRQTDLGARVDELLRQSPPGRPKLRAVE